MVDLEEAEEEDEDSAVAEVAAEEAVVEGDLMRVHQVLWRVMSQIIYSFSIILPHL